MSPAYARPWWLYAIQLSVAIVCVALICDSLRKNRNHAGLTRLQQILGRCARHKTRCIFAVGLLTLLLRAALLPLLGVPLPGAHDEFSYLLAADTFAHGRTTNPTHPMWAHLETFHVLQQPTYMAMYPPAQGLVLAAGQVLGNPWFGECLVTGLMCSAICWMLQGWLPPGWALFGAALAVLRLGTFSYWMNGYWSSSVVALGGALVLGAFPRMRRRQRIRDALWMALGLAVLANSRPYEGLVLSMMVAVALLKCMIGPHSPGLKIIARHVIAPLSLALGVAALGTGYYNNRVTGSPLRMGYQLDSQTINPVPFLLWMKATPEPAYRHTTMRKFYEEDLRKYWQHRSLPGFVKYCFERTIVFWGFYLRTVASIPLIVLPWMWRDRRMRFPLVTAGVFYLALMIETWGLPHYVAPATGIVFLIVAQCSRRMALWQRRDWPVGRTLVQAVPLLLLAGLLFRVASIAAHAPNEGKWPRGNLARAETLASLEKLPGKQLAIVNYGPDHPIDAEWVYNAADIDGSKVVWARDMGAHDNQELLQYFHDRQVWLLQVNDGSPPQISPYPIGLSAH